MATINLAQFTKSAATTTSASASGRGDSAYTLLGGDGVAVTKFLGYVKVSVVKGTGCLYLSPQNIKSVPMDILEQVATGSAKADFEVHKSEHPAIGSIMSLFYSDAGPRTKCHDFGFFRKPTGEYCFFALQGTSIKEVIL